MANITSQLDINRDRTRVGLIYWSNEAYTHFNLNSYFNRENTIQAILRTPFLGQRTHTASALEMLYKQGYTAANGDRIDATNIAIVITDGNSNINPENTPIQGIEARTAGIHIIVAAVGTTFVNHVELEGIASAPTDHNIFNVAHYDDLPNIMDQLVSGTCNGGIELIELTFVNIVLSGKCCMMYILQILMNVKATPA